MAMLPPPSRPGNDPGSGKPAAPPPVPAFQGQVFSPKPQSTDAFQAWTADRTPDNTSKLLKELQPTIRSAVKKYAGSDDTLAMGHAKQLVIDSLDRYDPKKASLNTYVDRQLQPLMRWQSRRRRVVRAPDRKQMELLRLLDAEKELESENGRMPSTLQLADHTGLSQKRIGELRRLNAREISSSTALSDGDGQAEVGDLAVHNDAAASKAWTRFVRADLGEVDQAILDHTLGLDGAEVLPNATLARRLKISPGAVSQRKARIQNLLDQEFALSPFG